MGVPKLFSYLYRNYPVAFSINQNQQGLNLDAIYLDANALLYPISEGTKIPEEIARSLLLVAQEYSVAYGCVCNIYMDGPAHMGKIRQQRMRRFLYEPTSTVLTQTTQVGERSGEIPIPSVVESPLLGMTVPSVIEWSRAVFSPGTEMMQRIHIYIEQHLSEFSGIDIYSSYFDPGEGEHKILSHIKEVSSTSSTRKYRVGIVGKDADLLLLAMSITADEGWNVEPYIIRHNDRLGDGGKTHGYRPSDPIYTVNCTLLREKILGSFSRQENVSHSIWDLILASFPLGNDFFPAIPEMSDVYSAIPLILSIAPVLYTRISPRIGRINWNGFLEFLDTLAATINTTSRFRSPLYEKWLQSSQKSTNVETLSLQSFESLYYFHVSSFPVNIQGMVLSWFTTVQWVFLYYHDGLGAASIAWQYPLHFSPTLATLTSSSVFRTSEMQERVLSLARREVPPLSPLQALAAVLPIWLHNLLPVSMRQKMQAISEYYPYAFSIQNPIGDPIIPIIPYEVVSSLLE